MVVVIGIYAVRALSCPTIAVALEAVYCPEVVVPYPAELTEGVAVKVLVRAATST